ncbi:DUF4253 domain-containing protein [Streptomyces spongiae]|uniref:DUF4253 domain-containing protein n=1 Tax=Streptomyces spongiae TaxID=565072 RepID=A0A5N8XR42_9ACTN|nr:DUF4253 domain-containing protein [Streptomyces spongiae]MPY61874.1 DUF4253 domain-containing protein [Streptomyces spongiae]
MSDITVGAGDTVPPEEVTAAVSPDGVRAMGFLVPRTQAFAVWKLWRERHAAGSGWYPVLSSVNPQRLVWNPPDAVPKGGREAVVSAVARDPDEVIAEIMAAFLVDTLDKSADQEAMDEWIAELTPQRLAKSLAGPLSAPRPADPWQGYLGFDPEFWFCLVEARHGYELPVLLPGLPDAPNWWVDEVQRGLEPSDHLAFLRSWHERFGADPYYMDGSNMRLAVDRPPLTPEAAAQAAVERFSYCEDNAPDLPVLGDGEIRSTVWTFWWD